MNTLETDKCLLCMYGICNIVIISRGHITFFIAITSQLAIISVDQWFYVIANKADRLIGRDILSVLLWNIVNMLT